MNAPSSQTVAAGLVVAATLTFGTAAHAQLAVNGGSEWPSSPTSHNGRNICQLTPYRSRLPNPDRSDQPVSDPAPAQTQLGPTQVLAPDRIIFLQNEVAALRSRLAELESRMADDEYKLAHHTHKFYGPHPMQINVKSIKAMLDDPADPTIYWSTTWSEKTTDEPDFSPSK